MTETAIETPAVPTIQLDDFGKLALQKYTDSVTSYNKKVEAAKAVSSREEFAQHFMDNAPELDDINEEIQRVESALESLLGKRVVLATPLIEPAYNKAVSESGVDFEALDEQLKFIKSTSRYLTQVYGKEVLTETPDVENLKRGGSASGTSASGGRRIRGFEVYVNGVIATQKNAKGELKSTFSAAAKIIGCEVVDLQRAFFSVAGSEDTKADSFPTMVEFDFEFKEDTHKIRAVKVDDSADSE